jgi:VanZ family protein
MTSLHKYLLVLGLLVIFAFSLLPGQMTPAYVVNHDKAAHALAFVILSFMLAGAFPFLSLGVRFMLLALLALIIETLQFLFVGRGFSIEDLLYDLAGMLLFVVLSISFGQALRMIVKFSSARSDTIANR